MGPTKHDIRNGIRGGIGRFKREVTAPFTKEELGSLCAELGITATDAPVESTTKMRQRIRVAAGITETVEEAAGGNFSRAELEMIADALGVEPVAGDEPDPLF